MAIYVMSDIHGNYEKYKKALEVIDLKDEDTLYILGDVMDRGQHPIKILQDMMYRHNVIPILGNHEFIAWSILRVLMKEVTDENLDAFSEEFLQDLQAWFADGGKPTLDEFRKLPRKEQQGVLEYLKEFILYEEVVCNGKTYILIHAGLKNFSPEKALYEYTLYDLISARTDYQKVYYADKILVTGHTPVQNITHGKSHTIYKKNNHIAIDCGCGFGGKLAVIRLDDEQEFYI